MTYAPLTVVNPQNRVRHPAPDMRQAMLVAVRMAGRSSTPIHIHLAGRPLDRNSLVAVVQRAGNGYRVRFNQALQGLGQTLTNVMCDSEAFASSWRERVNSTINSGAAAAAVGATLAGLLGGITKRPLLGAALGAAIGWGTHAIWTGPQRVG